MKKYLLLTSLLTATLTPVCGYSAVVTAYSDINTSAAWSANSYLVGTYLGNNYIEAAQFTATATGTLDSINAMMTNAGTTINSITLELFSNNPSSTSAPDHIGNILWSQTFINDLSAQGSNQLSTFSGITPLTLTAGETYWLYAFDNTTGGYHFWFNNNTAATGEKYQAISGTPHYYNPSVEYGFQINVNDGQPTNVTPTSVPIPATFLLMLPGLFGMSLFRKKS